MSLINKNNKVNVLTLLTLSAALLLTACGGSSSNDIPPLFYEFKDLKLTLEDIEAPRLALGHNHTCFITSDEQVKCWGDNRSEEHTSELQSRPHLVCRLLLEKKKNK